jgi:thiamine biosynthesis protein ThiI
MKKIIYLKYGELILKGKNKKDFINCLFRNVQFSLKKIKGINIIKFHDCMILENINDKNEKKIIDILKRIPGFS